MKRIGLLTFTVLGLLTLSACGARASPVANTQTSGSLSATLQVLPYPPAPMEETRLELTLRDADKRPVSGATVELDLIMPDMEMAANRPQATEAENGLYRANAIFTMAGEWQIRVEVSYQDQSEEFVFTLHTR